MSTSIHHYDRMIYTSIGIILWLSGTATCFSLLTPQSQSNLRPTPNLPLQQQQQQQQSCDLLETSRTRTRRYAAVKVGTTNHNNLSPIDPLDNHNVGSNYGDDEGNDEDGVWSDSTRPSTSLSSSFYDIPEYHDDDLVDKFASIDVSNSNAWNAPSTSRSEADILEEREDRLYLDSTNAQGKIMRESCVLVGVEDLSAQRRARDKRIVGAAANINDVFTMEESMTEMKELIKTAGLELVGVVTQRLNEVNPKTYIGTGKVKEVDELLKERECCTVVFDAELTPGQQKALENSFNRNLLQNDFLGEDSEIKVIDRTALILDIFAQHAKTREGKLQVDLALHEYRKPRLTRMWTHLERQSGAGGVGLRGPGETQLEVDKRLVRDRIIVLKQKIDDVQKQRAMKRRARDRMGLPVLSLVGYTNAGKSTLLNYLTRAGVMAESILFATLDPTTRKVKLPGYKTHPEVLLTDTVGFIQKLPTQLVAAFRATLEEVNEADVLIHVIDVSNPTWEKQEAAVLSVLEEIGAGEKAIVRVLNKIDLIEPEEAEYLKYEASTSPYHTVALSALQGEGMQDFVSVVEDALAELLVPIEIELPYSKGDELHAIHEQGNVEVVDYRESGTYVRALVPQAVANRLECYRSSPNDPRKSSADPKPISDRNIDIDWAAIGRGRHKLNDIDAS